MPPIDLAALTRYVRTILTHPQAELPPTGDSLLDDALADLAGHRRAGLALPALAVSFWTPAASPSRALPHGG